MSFKVLIFWDLSISLKIESSLVTIRFCSERIGKEKGTDFISSWLTLA